jgi:hypothetical protein
MFSVFDTGRTELDVDTSPSNEDSVLSAICMSVGKGTGLSLWDVTQVPF